jgi:5-methylcytosine-specific restriction protein B
MPPILPDLGKTIIEVTNIFSGCESLRLLSVNPRPSPNEQTTDKNSSLNIKEVNMPSLNTILYGPPGTGKTFSTIKKAIQIIEGLDYKERTDRKNLKNTFDSLLNKGQIGFTTFHPSYSYEDFVIGYKPFNVKGKDGTAQISYEPTPGVFLRMCEKAYNDEDNKYVLIIDEINRGNLSSIFGELMTVIEDSKRIGKPEEIRLELPIKMPEDKQYELLKDGRFGVPDNLYVIGTMNTADRSAALMDVALRRRFEFQYMPPRYDLLDFTCGDINIGNLLNTLNIKIETQRDRDHIIGHAYFMQLDESSSPEDLRRIFKQKVLPLLEEYFYEDWRGLIEIVGNLITENNGIYRWSDCLDSGKDIQEFLNSINVIITQND